MENHIRNWEWKIWLEEAIQKGEEAGGLREEDEEEEEGKREGREEGQIESYLWITRLHSIYFYTL